MRHDLIRSGGEPPRDRPPVGNGRTYLFPEGAPADEYRFDLGSLARALWDHRWWLLVFGLTGLVAGGLLTLVLPERWESTSTFLVEPRDSRERRDALAPLERVGEAESAETEIELLTSRRVLEPVVDELDLHVRITGPDEVTVRTYRAAFEAGPDAEPGTYTLERRANRAVGVRDADGLDVAEAPAGETLRFAGMTVLVPDLPLGDGLEVEVRRYAEAVEGTRGRLEARRAHSNADLIRLTCGGRTAEAAHDLCREVGRTYLALRSELQHSEATAAAAFLQKQATSVGRQLSAAEDSLAMFRTRNRAVALEERATEEVRQFAQLRAQRDQLEAERRALSELISRLDSGEGQTSRYRELASFPTFLKHQNQIVTQLVGSLVELENERSELAVRRTEVNPSLAAVNERIAEIENQLHRIAGSYEEALATQVRSLDQSLASSGSQLARIPDQEMESARLERQVSLLEDLYTFLQTRLREAQLAQAVTLPSVRIVDRASLPARASWPILPVNLGLGLFLGLLGGLTLAGYREWTDTSLRGRTELEQETGLPVLSMIPSADEPAPFLFVSGNGDGRATNPVVRVNQNQEMLVEAFRSLAVDVRYSWKELGQGELRSIALTSATRGEGKTFTACNLALTMASHSSGTLLVDGDTRASGVTRLFRLGSPRPGLRDIMEGRVSLEEARRHVQVGDENSLAILPSGGHSSESSSLLEPSLFARFLETAEASSSLVILDTPPFNVLSDTASIAAAVDAVVVVVRSGLTDREALEMTLERLRRVGGRILGVVLNDVTLPEHYRSYSYVNVEVQT